MLGPTDNERASFGHKTESSLWIVFEILNSTDSDRTSFSCKTESSPWTVFTMLGWPIILRSVHWAGFHFLGGLWSDRRRHLPSKIVHFLFIFRLSLTFTLSIQNVHHLYRVLRSILSALTSFYSTFSFSSTFLSYTSKITYNMQSYSPPYIQGINAFHTCEHSYQWF